MRPAALCGALLLLSSAASAQLTFLPQIGTENAKNTLRYNNGGSFAPLGSETSPRANVRLDYRFKGGHGPFLGVGTSPAVVDYSFADPATGGQNFKATNSDRHWRLEGGYMYSTKPIYFKKGTGRTSSVARATETIVVKKSCGSYTYRSSCGSAKQKMAAVKNKALNMRIQPALGMAYIPSVDNDLSVQNGANVYKVGNWNTALLAGTGFEFGRGAQRLFTLNFQYVKGVGNLEPRTLVTQTDAKTTTTRLSSDASSWNVALGLPFSLTKRKSATSSRASYERSEEKKSKCGEQQYKSRCTRKVVI